MTPPELRDVRFEQARIRLTLTDVLGFYDDSVGTYLGDPDPSRRSTHVFWLRVPAAWIDDGVLARARLRQICGFIYGDDWLYDGERSKYLVLADETKVLAPEDLAAQPWQGSKKIYAFADETFVAVAAAAF